MPFMVKRATGPDSDGGKFLPVLPTPVIVLSSVLRGPFSGPS